MKKVELVILKEIKATPAILHFYYHYCNGKVWDEFGNRIVFIF